MRAIISLIILVLLSFGCKQEAKVNDSMQETDAIFVLIENGGTIAEEDQDDAQGTALHLLQQLTTLSRRKSTRNTQVHILFSSLPNRITWSGTPRQLLEQSQDVVDMIKFKDSFSDLVMAFDQIETTINLTQPDHVRLYWIGSTINVPFQSTKNGEISVEVPQPVPSNLALGHFADRLSTLKIFHVHPDQDQMLQSYLAGLGVLAKAKAGKIDFALLGKAQTKARLDHLL